MQNIVRQTLDFYFTKMRKPEIQELQIQNTELLEKKACCFVTLYVDGEIHGSAGNIKEIKENIVQELIDNTIHALTEDKRFAPLTVAQSEKIRFRIDTIEKREMIEYKDIEKIDPIKQGVIVIQRNYEKLAVILPNIHPKLLSGKDCIAPLLKKLEIKKIDDTNCIIYRIETQSVTNF